MFGKRKDSKNKAMRDNEELTPWERQQLLREENIEKKQKKSKKILVSSNLVKFNASSTGINYTIFDSSSLNFRNTT